MAVRSLASRILRFEPCKGVQLTCHFAAPVVGHRRGLPPLAAPRLNGFDRILVASMRPVPAGGGSHLRRLRYRASQNAGSILGVIGVAPKRRESIKPVVVAHARYASSSTPVHCGIAYLCVCPAVMT